MITFNQFRENLELTLDNAQPIEEGILGDIGHRFKKAAVSVLFGKRGGLFGGITNIIHKNMDASRRARLRSSYGNTHTARSVPRGEPRATHFYNPSAGAPDYSKFDKPTYLRRGGKQASLPSTRTPVAKPVEPTPEPTLTPTPPRVAKKVTAKRAAPTPKLKSTPSLSRVAKKVTAKRVIAVRSAKPKQQPQQPKVVKPKVVKPVKTQHDMNREAAKKYRSFAENYYS